MGEGTEDARTTDVEDVEGAAPRENPEEQAPDGESAVATVEGDSVVAPDAGDGPDVGAEAGQDDGGDAGPAPAVRTPLRIEIDHTDAICYALAYNRMPVIKGITVENVDGGLVGQLTITASVRIAGIAAPLTHPYSVVMAAPGVGQTVSLDAEKDFRVDDRAVVDLFETANASLEVVVTDEAGTTQTERRDVTVYARNQWINPLIGGELFEVTAAFVQPNHPSVNEVLAEAVKVLERQGRTPSLEGYQGGPQRAAEIGEAIFLALGNFVDNYGNLPAGYDEIGQKVRPLDEVLAQRQGNCIELACAYASCLEQAGLLPVVFLVHGHAFCGFFLRDQLREDQMKPVVTDFREMITWLDSGEIIAAETTMICRGTTPFAAAVKAVRSQWMERDPGCAYCHDLIARGVGPEHRPHLYAMIDIEACHAQGVLPLPARVERDGIVTVVIDNGPARPAVVERYDATTRRLLPDTPPARVQQWKNALLDLTFRNSLLNFKPERTGIALFPPEERIAVIEDSISAGGPVTIKPGDSLNDLQKKAGFRHARELKRDEWQGLWDGDRAIFGAPSSEGNESMIAKLRRLVSRAKVEEEETGSNNLFLTIGSLRWTDPRSAVGEVVSPIFLVPIRVGLRRGQTEAQIMLDDGGFTTPNYCLIEALRVKHNMTLQWFADDMRDDFGLDVTAGLQALRREILEKGLANRYGFEVLEDAAIGFLRFGKVRLWRDLDEHWKAFAENAVVSHLIEGGRSQFVDPAGPDGEVLAPPRDADLLNPQPVDGAQANAITRALAGRSFVLEGPPGTGKSQTITNLLANALARGKRVLFVAEKQAALEVVHERLQAAGLDPFCLELHSKGSRPDDIKNQLKAALDFVPVLDRTAWDRIDERFGELARVLDTYRDKVHGAAGVPLSYYAAYMSLLRLGDGPTAEHTRRLVDVMPEEIASYQQILAHLGEVAADAQPRPGHPWALAATTDFDAIDRVALGEAIGQVARAAELLGGDDRWLAVAREARTLTEISGIADVLALAIDGFAPSMVEWREIVRPDWADGAEASVEALGRTLDGAGDLTGGIGVAALDGEYAEFRAAVADAVGSFAIGRKGRVKRALGPLADQTPFASAEVEAVLGLVDRLVAASEATTSAVVALRALAGPVVAADWFPSDRADVDRVGARVALIRSAGAFLASGSSAAEATLGVATGLSAPAPATLDALGALVAGFATIGRELGATEESRERWAGDRTEVEALTDSVGEWAESVENGSWRRLQRWLGLAAEVEKIAHALLAGFRRQLLTGEISGDDARDAFDRALMEATINEVGEERGLDVFDPPRHDRTISEFVATLGSRQEMARKVIPTDLYEARSFDAAAGRGQVGELKAELGSKRRGARSVRALLSKYPDLIVSLTPCFLMSPDSVANFLEPGKIRFDLVVFDEASQIPVSSAVGAMGRATSVVVVGDSRQMPPTAVAVARGPVEDDVFAVALAQDAEAVTSDAESILDECVESRLDQEWLAWHYRSRDEILIDFSNHHYYDRRLSSFPPSWKEVPGCGLRLIRVDGQFDHGGRRTNVIEAQRIADLVAEIARDPEHRTDTIGIVTLNLEQRELVEERLRAIDDERVRELIETEDPAERLFVLNLESVQGRERDVIILGTSFSKRVDGRKMPLNFGPLNNAGGERRLNVAVTRARKKVFVVSSFDPEELETASAVGMIHLREYLELARAVTNGNRPEGAPEAGTDEDKHRAAIAEAFRRQGLVVSTEVGLSAFKVDLALTVPEMPDRWLVGVLLDGPVWAGRPLAADRDALPLTVLGSMMGWPHIARIWLPAWRIEAEDIVTSIAARVRDIAARPPEELDPRPPEPESAALEPTEIAPVPPPLIATTPPSVASSAPAAKVAAANARPFVEIPQAVIIGDVDAAARRDPVVLAFAESLANRHGPISDTEVIKRTLNACGLARVRDARVAEFRHLLPREQVVASEFGRFVFPADLVASGTVDRERFTWYRTSTFAQRTIDAIAPHEVANAAVEIVTGAFSIEEEELAAEVLKTFGYSRRTAEPISHVRRVIAWAVGDGYLVRGADGIRVDGA